MFTELARMGVVTPTDLAAGLDVLLPSVAQIVGNLATKQRAERGKAAASAP